MTELKMCGFHSSQADNVNIFQVSLYFRIRLKKVEIFRLKSSHMQMQKRDCNLFYLGSVLFISMQPFGEIQSWFDN